MLTPHHTMINCLNYRKDIFSFQFINIYLELYIFIYKTVHPILLVQNNMKRNMSRNMIINSIDLPLYSWLYSKVDLLSGMDDGKAFPIRCRLSEMCQSWLIHVHQHLSLITVCKNLNKRNTFFSLKDSEMW